MIYRTLKVLALLVFAAGSLGAQETYFSYDFEFEGVPPEGFPLFAISELNEDGSGTLIGQWSGDDFQLGDPSSHFAFTDCGDVCDSSGIVENPFGGSLLFIDRPVAPATHLMNLTDTIQLPGSTFSVTLGTRRTGGGFPAEPKSYDFFGLDDQGNESFRIRVLADGSTERLGYVADGVQVADFPTVQGEDMADDIANTGGVPFGVGDDIVRLTLRMGGSGYTVQYENLNGSNAWVSAAVPFNGPGANLAQVGLSYGGVVGVNNEQVGFFIDDVLVTGFQNLLLGDFDFNGKIDMADFMTLAGNFGTQNSEGDFDFNGTVDLSDWVGFKAAYNADNAPAGAAAVPEPGGIWLLGLGSIVALLSRGRQRQVRIRSR